MLKHMKVQFVETGLVFDHFSFNRDKHVRKEIVSPTLLGEVEPHGNKSQIPNIRWKKNLPEEWRLF